MGLLSNHTAVSTGILCIISIGLEGSYFLLEGMQAKLSEDKGSIIEAATEKLQSREDGS